LKAPHLELVFEGLDTYADVYVNGRHVLSADNMFRAWKVPISALVQSKGNTLKVRFRSPVREDLPKLEKLGYPLPASNDQSEVGGLGGKKISVFARKAPYHYGWDWGPRFVTCGIWREVRLEARSEITITDLFVQQLQVNASAARLKAIAEIDCDREWSGELRISTEAVRIMKDVRLQRGSNTVELEMEMIEPKLWWCRGLGNPHLYVFAAELVEGGETVSMKSVRTGLRSIRLVREKDAWGTSFYVELNGVPVFAKGANHIPNDSFITEATNDRYRHEIATAAESNMNMLRVWGGGIYEDKAFYELCDEYGILVWQDFMFACSMYPGDEAFLENVRLEAEENVKRLRNHPCIALWCGNNEIDTAWSHYDENGGWGWKQQYGPEIRARMWEDYENIFHRILPEAVSSFAPGADYWPSSPMCALTGSRSQHAFSTSVSGDVHYWGVWHAVEPFENYTVNIGRFMSEYGFQSFPEYKSVRMYAEPSDMALESEVMLAHQRNNRGNQLIKQYMDMYLKEPRDFPSFLYMSQVLQAEAMKTAIEAHRRRKPFCMGSLYWQMNDCWPVASWAGMDYFGRWKALQYYAKRSFRDILLSIDGTDGVHVDIHIVSDVLVPVNGTLHVKLLDFSGAALLELSRSVAVEPNAAKKVLSLTAEELLGGRDPASVMLYAELLLEDRLADSKEHYFVPIKHISIGSPAITVTDIEGSGGTRFVLETDMLAKQVWVASEAEGFFSDNYFDLIPGIPRTIEFLARGAGIQVWTPSRPGALQIRSMADFTLQ
jgi:beta-mannosidase